MLQLPHQLSDAGAPLPFHPRPESLDDRLGHLRVDEEGRSHSHLFREGIIEQAGGWEESEDENGRLQGGEAAITEEIRITLLHEIGHHFGLGEEELEELGYG